MHTCMRACVHNEKGEGEGEGLGERNREEGERQIDIKGERIKKLKVSIVYPFISLYGKIIKEKKAMRTTRELPILQELIILFKRHIG